MIVGEEGTKLARLEHVRRHIIYMLHMHMQARMLARILFLLELAW